MVKTNAFSTSYGVVVVTKDKKTVIIQRKIPYCVQDFLMKNKSLNINNYEESFYKNFSKSWDYLRFAYNLEFEDQFDFPHGQLQFNKRSLRKILSTTQNNSDESKNHFKKIAFLTAVREFKEETGYCFDFSPKNIANIDMQYISFIGLDNCLYEQIYFMVKVNKLKKCKNVKRDNFYESHLIDIEKAVKLFKKQQLIKRDGKDVMLSNALVKLEGKINY